MRRAMKDIDRNFEIERMMAEQDILLAYRDVMTEESVQRLLEISELKLNLHGDTKRLRKKVFNVLVECLQNVVNHGYKCEEGCPSILIVSQTPDAFIIKTGNMVSKKHLPAFEEKVSMVNSIDHRGTRDAYNDHLAKTDFSDKGGAGLGLLDMYRRSGKQIGYDVHPVDSERSFLTISVHVLKALEEVGD